PPSLSSPSFSAPAYGANLAVKAPVAPHLVPVVQNLLPHSRRPETAPERLALGVHLSCVRQDPPCPPIPSEPQGARSASARVRVARPPPSPSVSLTACTDSAYPGEAASIASAGLRPYR